MEFESFVEGPLLRVIFLIFIIGIFTRLCFFFFAIIISGKDKDLGPTYLLATIGRFFVPFYKAVTKKTIYTTLRYIFHVCIVVVPIWFGGHIILWEFSRFEWNWTALPYECADVMTLLLLVLALFFLIKRIMVPDMRRNSSKADYFLIVLTAVPFMTGYFLTHDTLESLSFLGSNMRTIHVLSSEAMLLAVPFLFCRTRLNVQKCTGCAACELNCPTRTIDSRDKGKQRIFSYSHYQCICCAACVSICPEEAAELRHEISLKRFFQIATKQEIQSVCLIGCERCGAFFAPEPQLNRKRQISSDDYLRFCPRCRKVNRADTLYQIFEDGYK